MQFVLLLGKPITGRELATLLEILVTAANEGSLAEVSPPPQPPHHHHGFGRQGSIAHAIRVTSVGVLTPAAIRVTSVGVLTPAAIRVTSVGVLTPAAIRVTSVDVLALDTWSVGDLYQSTASGRFRRLHHIL